MTRPLTSTERQRLRTPANLWRALIPILVVVIALVSWQRLAEPHSDGIHVIDTAPAIAAAQQQAGFPLALPAGLASRWRPTSTEFVPAAQYAAATFRIGYVTPAGRYAEFLESNGPADAVASQYGVLSAHGSSMVNGTAWQNFRTGDDKTLLRGTVNRLTVIVTGNAGLPELTELAGSLK